MQCGSILGGAAACLLYLRSLSHFELAFFEEQCRFVEHYPIMLKRLLLGYSGLLCTVVPFGIVLPKWILKRWKHSAMSAMIAPSLRALAFAAASLWLVYGAPRLSALHFEWECPVFSCSGVVLSPEDSQRTVFIPDFIDYNGRERALCSKDYGTEKAPDFAPIIVESVEHLQEIVLDAHRRRRSVRVVGAGFSSPLARFNPSYDRNITWISLQNPSFQQFRIITAGSTEGSDSTNSTTRPLVIAGAALSVGGNIHQNITWGESLLGRLAENRLAMPNVPGSVVQQLGSLLLTNSNGGSTVHAFDDAVLGLRFVNGRGELREVWRNSTETSEQGMGIATVFLYASFF